MFDYISTSHYGRCVKHRSNWYIKSVGLNRLYYVHSGSATILLDSVPHELKPGKIYLFPQNLKFEPLLTEQTNLDHTFFDFFSLPVIKMDSCIEIDPAEHPFIDHAARILFELGATYHTYPYLDRNEYSDVVESYLNNTLFLIDKTFPIQTIGDHRINTALEYIHKHYNENITLQTLTGITNLEMNYFIRLFKQYMNATPYQYIKKYRFNIALTLIKRKYPLSEVALRVGYADISSFSHAFKKVFGFYPSEILQDVSSP